MFLEQRTFYRGWPLKYFAPTAKYDMLIEENHAALQAAGHWGVPTMVFEGEPFFGQDRIDCIEKAIVKEFS